MMSHGLFAPLVALAQVLFIDLALAGDNAVVVGLAVAGLPARQQRKAILFGIGAASLVRVLLALVAVRLLAIVGLTLAGGVLLLWVCWRMWRELRARGGSGPQVTVQKTLRQAMLQIALADLSMSLDNVLAVAGAARDHVAVLVIGLALSVVLMGVAAQLIARLLERVPAIAWAGLAVVMFVAVRMIWDGVHQVHAAYW